MKLIYIANARMPTEKAHGLQIIKMCEVFGSKGLDLELLLPKRFNWIKEDLFEYYEVERNFKIKRLPCLDLIPLDKYIGHLGLWIESFTFFLSVFFYTLFRKADTIYTRDKFLLPLGLFKSNLIYEAHTFPKHYFLYSFFLKRIGGIIVITEKLKELFAKQGIPENKILTAPDGVDLEKFQIPNSKFQMREKLGLPQDRRLVFYTGHLYEWKGAQTLAEASQYLPADTDVYFVGGTAEDIQKFKVQSSKFKVNIVGHRPHSEIPYWLKAADVLVLPNSAKEDISKYWTSPIKMFEYMASKRPIVASNLPSLREILNENNSLLVKPDISEDLAQGIKKILQNFEFSAKISKRAFQDVQGFTWQKRAEKILRFLAFSRKIN